MKSIIQHERECFICGRREPLHRHHCLEGSYKQKSEAYGLTVWLCYEHHMMAHENEKLLAWIRKKAQEKAMAYYGWDTAEFITKIGRNFINE